MILTSVAELTWSNSAALTEHGLTSGGRYSKAREAVASC